MKPELNTPTRTQRILYKLLHGDSPSYWPAKFLFRILASRKAAALRKIWDNPHVTSPDEMPYGMSAEYARRLWPGACRRDIWRQAEGFWPEDFTSASQVAQRAAEGTFDLLGSGEICIRQPDGRLRWHEDFKSGAAFPGDRLFLDIPRRLDHPGCDIKVPWELSRFQHVFSFLWTRPEHYRTAFLRQWEDWMQANPLARGVNWTCAMDVALRAVSWTAAMACWWDEWNESTRHALLAALVDHARFIRGNLERGPAPRTNHYFSNVVGLAVISVTLAGYPPAEKWADFAADQLAREILLEFAEDGFNRECSTTYHRLMLELATLGELACRLTGRGIPKKCRHRLAQAYRALALLAGVEYRIPLVGDNDSGKVFAMVRREDADVSYLPAIGRALLPEENLPAGPASPELLLLMGPDACRDASPENTKAAPAVNVSAALDRSGMHVLAGRAGRMIVRCGPIAYNHVGGHRHLDLLSMNLFVHGREFIVDPGQFCYTPWPQRSLYYRSSAAHAGVVVDGAEQTWVCLDRLKYCFIDIGPTRCRCDGFDIRRGEGSLCVRHGGYRRLPGGGDHVRRVRFDEEKSCWTVTDRFAFRGRHHYRWNFPLHPEVKVNAGADAWTLTRDSHTLALRWMHNAPRQSRVERQKYSPSYGTEVDADCIVFEGDFDGVFETTFILVAY